MTPPVILIPAAGQSSRMRGRDKLLEPIGGIPLLRLRVEAALATGHRVLVTLPLGHDKRQVILKDLDQTRLNLRVLQDADEGISASIRAGANWCDNIGVNSLMVMLADLPEIRSTDLTEMITIFTASPGTILRACDDQGKAGHPVIFPHQFFPHLRKLSGDSGAKDLLRTQTVQLHPLSGTRATTDLDTPESWEEWHSKTGYKSNTRTTS